MAVDGEEEKEEMAVTVEGKQGEKEGARGRTARRPKPH